MQENKRKEDASDSDSDDEPHLSSATMAALQEFLAEQKGYKEYEASLAEEVKEGNTVAELKEDWQLSQFWYTEETSMKLAREVLANSNGKVACISTPSVFKALKKIGERMDDMYLFEFDKRFSCYGDRFIFYDFNEPTKLHESLRNNFDYILIDPPFLNEECLNKFLDTVEFLSKGETRLVILSGLKVESFISERLGKKMKEMVWRPQHAGGLQNEFRCWASYPSTELMHGE